MSELSMGVLRLALCAVALVCVGPLAVPSWAGQTLVAQADALGRCEARANEYVARGEQPDRALFLLQREFRCPADIKREPSDSPAGQLIGARLESETIWLIVSAGPQPPTESPVRSPRLSAERKPLRQGPAVRPEPVSACVPKDYLKMDAVRAISELRSLGCSPTPVSKLHRSLDGVVLDQTPRAGTFPYGYEVVLTVAERGVVVPPVSGLEYDEAASKLSELSVERVDRPSWTRWSERVVSTDPASGTVVQRRSMVRVFVGQPVVSPTIALTVGIGLLGLAGIAVRRLWIRPRLRLSIVPLTAPEVAVNEEASTVLSVEASIRPAGAAIVEEGKNG